MDSLMLLVGRLSGAVGVLFCLVGGAARLSGRHWLAGFEALTLLQAGIAAMVFGSFCLLLLLAQRGKAG